jgi:CDP-glycerol glycerophosphotransferase
MRVWFDVQSFYYLTAYLPVARVLATRGAEVVFLFYRQGDFDRLLEQVAREEGLTMRWVATGEEALQCYLEEKPDWAVFGNAFKGVELLKPHCKTAQIFHGIGVKECYYDAPLQAMHVRFVEGEFRRQELQRRFPQANIVATGYAKLDPLFDNTQAAVDLAKLGLDPSKKTLLYAPTFYPSSIECMPDDWPQQLAKYNLIVKPHYFSWASPKYAAQRAKFATWAKAVNVYVAGVDAHSLLPFFPVSDVLISEASSSLFEFAALDKPVLWCDFLHLRWTYRGIFRFRFNKRMDPQMQRYEDIGQHVPKFAQLAAAIEQALTDSGRYAAARRRCTQELIGPTDGRCAERIVDYLFSV